MIRLLAHPLTPAPLSILSLFLSLPVFRVLTEGGGGGEEPNHTTVRKHGMALHKSFNTLCLDQSDMENQVNFFMTNSTLPVIKTSEHLKNRHIEIREEIFLFRHNLFR
jgi:hypothetical protein